MLEPTCLLRLATDVCGFCLGRLQPDRGLRSGTRGRESSRPLAIPPDVVFIEGAFGMDSLPVRQRCLGERLLTTQRFALLAQRQQQMWNVPPSASPRVEEGHVDVTAEPLHCRGITVWASGGWLQEYRRPIPIRRSYPRRRFVPIGEAFREIACLEEQQHGVPVSQTSARKRKARAPSGEGEPPVGIRHGLKYRDVSHGPPALHAALH